MKILKDFNNFLLKRREILFVIESEKNPGFEEAKKIICEKFKTEEEKIAIKSIKNNFGTREFKIEVFIYNTKEQKDLIEPKKKSNEGAKTGEKK